MNTRPDGPPYPHHQETRISGSRPSRLPLIITATVSGLLAIMLMSLAAPHLTEDGEANWVMTISLGVLVAVMIYVIGIVRRKSLER